MKLCLFSFLSTSHSNPNEVNMRASNRQNADDVLLTLVLFVSAAPPGGALRPRAHHHGPRRRDTGARQAHQEPLREGKPQETSKEGRGFE